MIDAGLPPSRELPCGAAAFFLGRFAVHCTILQGFALRGELLCPRGQSNQNAARDAADGLRLRSVPPRPCLKNVNLPKRRVFSRHAALIFLAIHQGLLRQIALPGEKNPSPLGIFPIFKQDLTWRRSECKIDFPPGQGRDSWDTEGCPPGKLLPGGSRLPGRPPGIWDRTGAPYHPPPASALRSGGGPGRRCSSG